MWKSKNYEKVKRYYSLGAWTEKMVLDAVGRWITAAEAAEIVRREDIEDRLPPPRSTNLTLVSGFETYNTSNCYIKGNDGVVHVTLSCKPSESETAKNGAAIARLPEGYRPKQGLYFWSYDPYWVKQQTISVKTDGTISVSDIDSTTWGRVMCELSFTT